MEVAGLQAQDERSVDLGECDPQRIDHHAPLRIRRHHRRRTESEIPEREVDGCVTLGAREHGDLRCALQPLGINVPPGSIENVAAGGSEPGPVGHGRTRREADIRPRGETQQIE